jgi:hypothetical protein
MSKIILTLAVVEDLRTLANSVEALANAIQENGLPEAPTSKGSKSVPLTLEQVRAVLAAKSQNGKQPEVKSLITEFGATKLTDIDPSKYEELLKKAGEI